MRAVSLSNENVQKKIAQSFVALKVVIAPGTKEFPLEWPAMRGWSAAYGSMGGEKCEGITGCSVVGSDREVEYGNTGSAFVWELFDSISYDAGKFEGMLDRALERWKAEQKILEDPELEAEAKKRRVASHRDDVRRAVSKEGQFRLPPKGFTIDGAVELFRLTGDIP